MEKSLVWNHNSFHGKIFITFLRVNDQHSIQVILFLISLTAFSLYPINFLVLPFPFTFPNTILFLSSFSLTFLSQYSHTTLPLYFSLYFLFIFLFYFLLTFSLNFSFHFRTPMPCFTFYLFFSQLSYSSFSLYFTTLFSYTIFSTFTLSFITILSHFLPLLAFFSQSTSSLFSHFILSLYTYSIFSLISFYFLSPFSLCTLVIPTHLPYLPIYSGFFLHVT